jgi:SAM-dependent methyltransferase
MPDGSFDVVICAFGIFFAPDMATAATELWRVVRPGGTLLVATWGQRLLEPANTIYWDAVEAVRPDLRPAAFPWLRIAEPAGLTSLFEQIGAPAPEIESETIVYPASPEDFWTMVLSSGHRLVLDAMDHDEVSHVRAGLMERIANRYSGEVTTDVLYARACKV